VGWELRASAAGLQIARTPTRTICAAAVRSRSKQLTTEDLLHTAPLLHLGTQPLFRQLLRILHIESLRGLQKGDQSLGRLAVDHVEGHVARGWVVPDEAKRIRHAPIVALILVHIHDITRFEVLEFFRNVLLHMA
jgi:hypothetical protein